MKSLLLDAEKRRYYAPLAICLALIVLLLLAPTGFEGPCNTSRPTAAPPW